MVNEKKESIYETKYEFQQDKHTLQRTRHLKCGSGDIDNVCNVLGSQPTTKVFTLYVLNYKNFSIRDYPGAYFHNVEHNQ